MMTIKQCALCLCLHTQYIISPFIITAADTCLKPTVQRFDELDLPASKLRPRLKIILSKFVCEGTYIPAFEVTINCVQLLAVMFSNLPLLPSP